MRPSSSPAIAVAEFYFLSAKLGQPIPPSDLLAALDAVGGIELSDLGRAQLERLDRFPEIPEMHDRLIAAEAAALDAPVVTRDETLTGGGLDEEIGKAEGQLRSVQMEEDRAIRLYVSGKITEDQLDHQRKFITERLEILRNQLDGPSGQSCERS